MAKQKAKTYEVQGTYRYMKGFPQNKDTRGPEGANWDEHGGMYITDFIMDEDNLAIFEESGSQWKTYGHTKAERTKHNLEQGEFMIRPRRKHVEKYAQYGGPPVVVLADGTPIDPTEGMGVGNGSTGYLQYTVYQTPLHAGSRWLGSQIIDWKQYPITAPSGAAFANRGESHISMSEDAPMDEDTPAPKARVKVVDVLEDDEIPF